MWFLQVLPQWGQGKQYVVDILQTGLGNDVFSTSPQLQFPVSTTNGVLLNLGGAFTKGNYYKYNCNEIRSSLGMFIIPGSSILRMARAIIGKEAFQAGVQNFVQT